MQWTRGSFSKTQRTHQNVTIFNKICDSSVRWRCPTLQTLANVSDSEPSDRFVWLFLASPGLLCCCSTSHQSMGVRGQMTRSPHSLRCGTYLLMSFGCRDNDDSQDAEELKDRPQKQTITQHALQKRGLGDVGGGEVQVCRHGAAVSRSAPQFAVVILCTPHYDWRGLKRVGPSSKTSPKSDVF